MAFKMVMVELVLVGAGSSNWLNHGVQREGHLSHTTLLLKRRWLYYAGFTRRCFFNRLDTPSSIRLDRDLANLSHGEVEIQHTHTPMPVPGGITNRISIRLHGAQIHYASSLPLSLHSGDYQNKGRRSRAAAGVLGRRRPALLVPTRF